MDANLPPALADWLRQAGHDAEHVDDVLTWFAPDAEIWERARDAGAIVITKDSDFRDRARRDGGVSVVWVRSGNLKLAVFLAWFARRLDAALALSQAGERVVEMR